jgi:outer membrane protein assembly factor BamD
MKNSCKYLIILFLSFLITLPLHARVKVFCPTIDILNNNNVFSEVLDTLPTAKKRLKGEPKPKKRKKDKNKKVTFQTFDYNYERALNFYENGQYLSAARLFEELYPLAIGTNRADTILFFFANCYYQNRDFEMAAFHFKDYVRRYPRSERTELAHLMAVKAIYNLSPYYALDQMETNYAIEELNLFISLYPQSKYMDECNGMLDDLRNKLAKKDFEIIKLYFNTEHYQATQIAITNFLKLYSYSPYAAEAAFILVKNNYQFAKKSVEKKKVERYRDCVEAYQSFLINYPESTWLKEAKKYADDAQKQIDRKTEKKA